jgi:DNA-binding transcriptional MerR regulator
VDSTNRGKASARSRSAVVPEATADSDVDQDVQLDGLYIGQVARMLGVSTSVLRSWEDDKLVAPGRTSSGYRVYSTQDIKRLNQVRDLIRSQGMSAARARQLLDGQTERPSNDQIEPRSGVSERLRLLRRRKGLSLRAVAGAAGLSASSVSAIERGRSAPSVGTLHRLAAALDTTVPKLLGTPRGRSRMVVSPQQRQVMAMDTPGVVFENLYAIDTQLQSILITVEPGHGSEESYRHEGEEFLYVLEGRLNVVLDELHTHALEPQDAMTFESRRPHRWFNPGDVRAVIVWVNTPPSF